MRFRFSILILMLLVAVARGERITVDPPLKPFLTFKKDRTAVGGQLVAYDDDSFDVLDAKKQTVTVKWDELEARNVYQIHERLLTSAGGDKWLSLAQELAPLPDGKQWAERALVKAIKLDPAIKE